MLQLRCYCDALIVPLDGRFHSILGQSIPRGGSSVDHPEYIVFKEAQAVPIAVVTYRHKASCRCSRCSAS